MQKYLWDQIKDNEWRKQIVKASVPLWKYKNGEPIAVASACIVEYMNCRFVLSIAHATIASSIWHMEVHSAEQVEEGQWRTKLQPLEMGFLTEFYFEKNNVTDPKMVDFTYRMLKPSISSFQVLNDPENNTIVGFERAVLKANFDISPSKNKKYGFYGKVRFGGVKDQQIIFEDRLEEDLTYVGEEGQYFVFELSHKYGSHDNYRGCSGAPVIDQDNNLIGLVSYGIKSKNLIYAINISKYRSVLEIETKPF
ncbi:hypothetical protein K6T82_03965 [Flavobacterium sp. 17A]|uniref:Trypsin-like peptidase domain-containing protein n=1 Tax=Flavobacterium potami TaxID=2872310 RepID=A0A9X1KPD5_9FLAO|nr:MULTISPECIES: CBS domain-containing protein [Flavobacterium]MBZ4033907.1 hypothetical protein [Flavobacterium potami]